ncbi:MAG TPA: hypothetical protein VIZ70_03780 [Propionibacteriaceae bacterium]
MSKIPTPTVEEERPDLALGGRGVVGDHELHRIGGQQSAATIGGASSQQHASKCNQSSAVSARPPLPKGNGGGVLH